MGLIREMIQMVRKVSAGTIAVAIGLIILAGVLGGLASTAIRTSDAFGTLAYGSAVVMTWVASYLWSRNAIREAIIEEEVDRAMREMFHDD